MIRSNTFCKFRRNKLPTIFNPRTSITKLYPHHSRPATTTSIAYGPFAVEGVPIETAVSNDPFDSAGVENQFNSAVGNDLLEFHLVLT
jgi:hypothetical protein